MQINLFVNVHIDRRNMGKFIKFKIARLIMININSRLRNIPIDCNIKIRDKNKIHCIIELQK